MDTEKAKKLKEAETLVDFLKQLWTTKNNGQNARVIRELCFWLFIVCSIVINPVFPFTLPAGVYSIISVMAYLSGSIAGVSRLDRTKEPQKITVLEVLQQILKVKIKK